jgi:hypothetical protein
MVPFGTLSESLSVKLVTYLSTHFLGDPNTIHFHTNFEKCRFIFLDTQPGFEIRKKCLTK